MRVDYRIRKCRTFQVRLGSLVSCIPGLRSLQELRRRFAAGLGLSRTNVYDVFVSGLRGRGGDASEVAPPLSFFTLANHTLQVRTKRTFHFSAISIIRSESQRIHS